MGRIRYVFVILLALLLFVCGCSSGKVTTAETPQPTPTTPPLAMLQATPEASELPPPELPVSTKRLKVKPTRQARPTRKGSVFRPPAVAAAKKPPPRKKKKARKRPAETQKTGSYPKADAYRIKVKKAEAASRTLDNQIQTGQLAVDYRGTGDLKQMVHFSVTNVSRNPVMVRLVPGMILNPGSRQAVQPLLTVEQKQVLLRPGESTVGALQAYCMDSRVPAPAPGQIVDYRFSTRTKDGGPRAVRAYLVAQKMFKSDPDRHAITQLAIWKALGQPVEEKHFQSVLGPRAKDQALRKEVTGKADKVLKSLS